MNNFSSDQTSLIVGVIDEGSRETRLVSTSCLCEPTPLFGAMQEFQTAMTAT